VSAPPVVLIVLGATWKALLIHCSSSTILLPYTFFLLLPEKIIFFLPHSPPYEFPAWNLFKPHQIFYLSLA